MAASSVVGLELWGKGLGAFVVAEEDVAVGSLDLEGPVESLDLAVPPRAVRGEPHRRGDMRLLPPPLMPPDHQQAVMNRCVDVSVGHENHHGDVGPCRDAAENARPLAVDSSQTAAAKSGAREE